MDVNFLYEFIVFEAMDLHFRFEFIVFGAMYNHFPYELYSVWGSQLHRFENVS